MPLFLKTESFTKETLSLLPKDRIEHLKDHRAWVESLLRIGQATGKIPQF